MKKVYQLLHTLSYGDAISSEALVIKRELQTKGYDSEIYAINVHPTLKIEAKSYTELSPDFDGDLIFHVSLGSPVTDFYKKCTQARRIMIYHNLTPAKWFEKVNPKVRKDLETGFKELPEICAVSDVILADSEFNAKELSKLGFNAEVLPLPFDTTKWSEAANAGIASLVRSDPKLHLLHVGRIAPNKCIEDIIKVFYFLKHHIHKDSKLWLVGIDTDTELYAYSLRCLAEELKLSDSIVFTGCFADSEVRALYENCSSYLCMSEHEGFCLPLLEAMYFGLPVIAFNADAVSETLGNGGILLKEKRHAEIAELIFKIYSDQDLKNKLIISGKERVKEYSLDSFNNNLIDLVLSERRSAASRSASFAGAQPRRSASF